MAKKRYVFVKDELRNLVIEECAKVAESQAQLFLSPGYAAEQPMGSFCERFACEEVAKAIRALSVPSQNHQSDASRVTSRHQLGGDDAK